MLIGAVAAYLQFTQQQQASHDLLISNQVSKGFEQLAGKEIAMRLGGIYALEGVMNTSEQYRVPVLEALCTLVRDSTRRIKTEQEIADVPTAIDIQAALTVIGRRSKGPGSVNLIGAKFAEVGLSGAHLSGADLRSAHLFNADLRGADLRGAHLEVAHLGGHLDGADLSGAHLDFANLSYAYLNDVNLAGANLTGANLTGANLTGAHLDGANLDGADLRGTRLNDADLSSANLSHAQLNDADLSGARLRNAMGLEQTQLDRACGTDARLAPSLTLPSCPHDHEDGG